MKTCFVISPIGEQGSETRKRSDIIFKYVIAPAVESFGYAPLRADQISEPGLITSQIIQHIVDDPLVIADLTDRNPNVFYELAIRHAIKKPLIQIIKKGEQIPFDVAGTRTIPVDHIDIESVEDAKKEIARQVDSVEKKPQDIESPISVALELQLLRQSDKPEERSLADIFASISEIKTTLQKFPAESFLPDQRLPKMVEDYMYQISMAQKEMLMMTKKFMKHSESMLFDIEVMLEKIRAKEKDISFLVETAATEKKQIGDK